VSAIINIENVTTSNCNSAIQHYNNNNKDKTQKKKKKKEKKKEGKNVK
jgi:hypothetical protein